MSRPNESNDTPDLVLTNGRIATGDARKPRAQAVAIKNGRFMLVGSDRDVTANSAGAKVIDLDGRTVIPGLIASQGALDRWQSSAHVAELLVEGHALSTAPDAQPVVRSGLETWFTLPGAPALPPPPKWKMALVTWCALLPQVIALGFVIPHSLPFPVPAMIGTAIPVTLLTWVLMPRHTRLLHGWLFASKLPQR